MSLITELKRRNIIRIAGLYLVGAWLVVQVAGTVLPMFGAPYRIAQHRDRAVGRMGATASSAVRGLASG